jgi:hypothetical protein
MLHAVARGAHRGGKGGVAVCGEERADDAGQGDSDGGAGDPATEGGVQGLTSGWMIASVNDRTDTRDGGRVFSEPKGYANQVAGAASRDAPRPNVGRVFYCSVDINFMSLNLSMEMELRIGLWIFNFN